jgi:hypothetical protein
VGVGVERTGPIPPVARKPESNIVFPNCNESGKDAERANGMGPRLLLKSGMLCIWWKGEHWRWAPCNCAWVARAGRGLWWQEGAPVVGCGAE